MVKLRAQKVQKVADRIPELKVEGDQNGDLVLISWGGTYGAVRAAAERLHKKGISAGHVHFHHIMPVPRNTAEVLGRFKHRMVCELNSGQFAGYLRMIFPDLAYEQYNEVTGQPFIVENLVNSIIKIYEKL